MLFRFFRQPAIDPLQVSMTGVKMGERFLLVGCDDPVLLAGLGAKVGLSGGAAAVLFDEHQAVAARRAAGREGFLLDSKIAREASLRRSALAQAYRVLRQGGRIEIVEGLGGSGPFAKPTVRPAGYDAAKTLDDAGFKPVRVLAEVTNFRFVEGLKVQA
jgi:hypothetical protein